MLHLLCKYVFLKKPTYIRAKSILFRGGKCAELGALKENKVCGRGWNSLSTGLSGCTRYTSFFTNAISPMLRELPGCVINLQLSSTIIFGNLLWIQNYGPSKQNSLQSCPPTRVCICACVCVRFPFNKTVQALRQCCYYAFYLWNVKRPKKRDNLCSYSNEMNVKRHTQKKKGN